MSTQLLLKSAELTSLKDIRSLIGQPLTLNIPQGEITATGVELILEYLRETYPNVELPCPKGTTFFQWKWLDPKEGTLPKRMAKWLKKRLKANADQKVIAHVGNLARQNSDDTQAYYFRITDKIDWDASQFGKSGGGCWWGRNGSNRSYGLPDTESYANRFIKNDGLAVQFFRNDSYSYQHGIGRLWLYVEPDSRFATTFNGYWENEGATLRLTRVVASYLGLSYKKCQSLRSNINIYINDDIGYFIGEEQALNFLKDNSYRIPKKIVYAICTRCTVAFDETSLSEGMCSPCYNATRKQCESCYVRADASRFGQVRTNDGIRDWCAGCISNYANSCAGCTNAFIAKHFNYPGCPKVDGVYMCTKCTMTARKCQDCGGKTQNTDAMDDPLCLKCEDEFESEIRIEDEDSGVVFWTDENGHRSVLGTTGPIINVTTVTNAMEIAARESAAAMQWLRNQLDDSIRGENLHTNVPDEDVPF